MTDEGLAKCNCKRKNCKLHGKCAECMAHHRAKRKPSQPYCLRKAGMAAGKGDKGAKDGN